MACGSWSGHCIWEPHGQSACCDNGYDFQTLYNFDQVDTTDRHCCFLGIWNDSDRECGGAGSIDTSTESAEGRYCGFGCETCDDEGGAGGLDQHEAIDGKRWLMPTLGALQRPWDARGLIHDLRSNEWWAIPGYIVYERGTCWQNDGWECFGADGCACFGANTVNPIIQHDDLCGGVGVGNPLPGLLPDEFFRTGYRWPPNSAAGHTQNPEQWYCRSFGDTRLHPSEGGHLRSMVVVDPTTTGGMDRVTEGLMDPALLSSNVCQSDRLAHCTGLLARNSPCWHHSAYGVCRENFPEDHCNGTFYATRVIHDLFNYLHIDSHNTARIIAAEGDERGVARNTAAWKNKILDAVRTQSFPLPPDYPIVSDETQPLRTITFDKLDHMAEQLRSNTGIGLFQREWIGDQGNLVKVEGGGGTGRLRQAGCEFEYKTYITRVKIVCRLILQQHYDRGRERKYIVPMVRLQIIATTTIHVSNLHRTSERGVDEPCSFVSSVREDVEGLRPVHPGLRRRYPGGIPINPPVGDERRVWLDVFNVWHDGGYIPTLYGSSTEPRDRDVTGMPVGDPIGYAESFMFFDDDGQQFIPSPLVEWRGFLGGNSKPTAEGQKFWTPDLTCMDIAEGFRANVPGWPTNVDTPVGPELDDPAGVYGGHVRIDFLPTEPVS